MLAREESEPEQTLWEQKVNKDDMKVYIKKQAVGSHRSKNHSYIKSHAYFNENYTIKKLVDSVRHYTRII